MKREPEACRGVFDLMRSCYRISKPADTSTFYTISSCIKVRVAIENSSSHIMDGHDPRATRSRTAANELTAAGNEDILTNGLNLMPS